MFCIVHVSIILTIHNTFSPRFLDITIIKVARNNDTLIYIVCLVLLIVMTCPIIQGWEGVYVLHIYCDTWWRYLLFQSMCCL